MTNSPTTRLATAAEAEQIVALALRGETPARIAKALDIPVRTVRHVCSSQAATIRAQVTDRCAVRFLRQEEMLTSLAERWYKDLMRDGFDKDKAAALIKCLERQSRLLGLDVSGGKALGSDEWLNDRSDAELVDLLEKRYGLRVDRSILEPSRN